MATLQVNSKLGSYLIHGFVFVDKEKSMYGVREASSKEGRVLYGIPNREHFSQFGLEIENIDNSKIAERIATKINSKLRRESNRLERLKSALLIATNSCLSTPFGNKSDVELKITKCQDKIFTLSN